MSIKRAVYLAGPSAVGKSAILDKIIKKFPEIDVSFVTYSALYGSYLNHDRASEMLLKRSGLSVFEHSIACPMLYEDIHKNCKHVLLTYSISKNLNSVTDLKYRSMVFDFTMHYHTYYRKLTKRFNDSTPEVMENLKNTFIIMDLTKNYYERYYNRLEKNYNGIDTPRDVYLFEQIIAFFALGNFLVNTFEDYDNIYMIVDADVYNFQLFHARDFDILSNIPSRTHFIYEKFNGSFVKNMANKIVEASR